MADQPNTGRGLVGRWLQRRRDRWKRAAEMKQKASAARTRDERRFDRYAGPGGGG